MSRTLKWILGILGILIVVALVAGGVWMWQHRSQMMTAYQPNFTQPGVPGAPNKGQGQPFGPRGYGDGDNGRGWGFRGPMMGMGRGHRFGFGPFGMGMFFLGGLFRLIVPLGLLALVAFAFYQLGKRAGRTVEAGPRRETTTDHPTDQTPTQAA